MWLIKRCYKQILKPLTTLINSSFESGIFPSNLKTSKITPIFKKGNPCLPNNYRPIAILPVFSKIFEKLFLNRLMSFLERFEILSPQQFGFRKKMSTIDAINKLVDVVVGGWEEREHTLGVFLDLSKAFDCVHHATLLQELEKCGVRGLPYKWIESYLANRHQCVQIGVHLSHTVEMSYGVPQGSILGPVLFLLYVNNLNKAIQHGYLVQYADDTTLCLKGKSIESLEISSFEELNSCIQFFSDKNLTTNSLKSNFINFCRRWQDSELEPVIMVDDTLLQDVESTKFLGMQLDRGLTWEEHVDFICTKVNKSIFVLRNLAKFCSLEILKMAYYGLIFPYLTYGIRLWASCTKHNFERIFRLQKKAIRVILKLNYRESCRDAFARLGFLTLPCLYILDVSQYCRFKCVLTNGGDVHEYDTRGRDNLRVQRYRTTAFGKLPSQVGVRFLNKIPEDIMRLQNPNRFKARLKQLLLLSAFYSVEEFMASRWGH